jgi:hypothetical protein
MKPIKTTVSSVLTSDPHAECHNCAEQAAGRPETEIWTLFDNYPYCPDCAPYEVEC